ncbi:protein adenylyltransferase SelO [Sporosarcina ureilytica]|uniref:Protein nucleotidyltransferase YdiU n=1 Tax=Sporosarcina ureilytica TaxID=298596 RepID=A0A1D8JF36_9BACL|nr:YdiU family protein [Sporosarcina ureilytica]AOV07324.1 hypothetical protein BI350_07065 [Sporosarcina ureilytica]
MKNQSNDLETGWRFDNSYARLPEKFFTFMEPNPVPEPKEILFNDALAHELGLNTEKLKGSGGTAIFAGNEVPRGAKPLAQAYAGHQFGNFTMLGDGRAMLIGEHLTPKDERVDIQLKGSGRTPYSRGGDGRAALGPMLREYIISEAMHALRIPTTRSLAVVTTGEDIMRETVLPAAILTRVAKSHLRVGTFEFAANWGTDEDIQKLADYAIERHYPEANDASNCYLALLEKVIEQQALLIAHWQLVGFIHGVMNTDNMTISGETIDYGPCAFMDTYDPATVFSSIDRRGRYAYQNQPPIGGWNLARFAESLIPILHDDEAKAILLAQEAISKYRQLYEDNWLSGMRKKLGLLNEESNDEALIEQLLELMEKYKADYTNTFLALTFNKLCNAEIFETDEFKRWYDAWQERITLETQSEEERLQLMKQHNPAIIPRNYYVEKAIEAAVERDDFSVVKQFIDALANPYAHTPVQNAFATVPDFEEPYRTFCGT